MAPWYVLGACCGEPPVLLSLLLSGDPGAAAFDCDSLAVSNCNDNNGSVKLHSLVHTMTSFSLLVKMFHLKIHLKFQGSFPLNYYD